MCYFLLLIIRSYAALFSFFSQRLENTVDGSTSGLECGNNVLSRRLQQSNNVGNKFVLGLDSSQNFEVLCAQINGLFYISGLQLGLSVLFVLLFLNELLN